MTNINFAPSSSLSRKQQAAALIQALQECLERNNSAGPNPEALRQVQDLARELHHMNGPFGEKPGSISGWAELFWSHYKHARWDTVAESGADRIRQFMLHDLSSMRSLNRQMLD